MGCEVVPLQDKPTNDETSYENYEVELREEVDSIKIGEIEDDGSLKFTVSEDTLADVAKTVLNADKAHSVELQALDSSGVTIAYHLLTTVEYISGLAIDSSKTFSIALIESDPDVVLGRESCSQECISVLPCNGCDLDMWSECPCISTSDNTHPSNAHCNHKVTGTFSESKFVGYYMDELAIRDIWN